MKVWKQKPLRLVEKELVDDLGNNNVIFVGSSTDMFAVDVPKDWISRVLARCRAYKNTYLFQSKNPRRFDEFKSEFPKDSIFGTTLESNINHGVSVAQDVSARAVWLSDFEADKKMVTIEPIMDFKLVPFVIMIKNIEPLWVNIGADSKHHRLLEPSKEKILSLIEELNKFTEVKQKDNLKRLLS
jgi:protein gp37